MKASELIKQRRISKKLSQKELADMVGVSQVTITRIETGQIKNTSIDIAAKIANALQTDIYSLFLGDYGFYNSSERDMKMKVLKAIVMYESREVLFKSFELNEDDPKNQQKLEEFKKMISMFKTGLTQTLINVGFFTKEDIEYYRENYK